MWKNKANFRIILRSLFLAVSSGLWIRAFHSKSTISFEIISQTFEMFLRQPSSKSKSMSGVITLQVLYIFVQIPCQYWFISLEILLHVWILLFLEDEIKIQMVVYVWLQSCFLSVFIDGVLYFVSNLCLSVLAFLFGQNLFHLKEWSYRLE